MATSIRGALEYFQMFFGLDIARLVFYGHTAVVVKYQSAGPSFSELFHCSKLIPSNKTMASEGGSPISPDVL